jgi:hypothetical protein
LRSCTHQLLLRFIPKKKKMTISSSYH